MTPASRWCLSPPACLREPGLAWPSSCAGLRLLQYLPLGSSDSWSCLLKQRLLDCECYDITFCVCTLTMWDAGRIISSGLGRAEGLARWGIDSSHFITAPSRPAAGAQGLTEQGHQPRLWGCFTGGMLSALQAPQHQPSTLQMGQDQTRQPPATVQWPVLHRDYYILGTGHRLL